MPSDTEYEQLFIAVWKVTALPTLPESKPTPQTLAEVKPQMQMPAENVAEAEPQVKKEPRPAAEEVKQKPMAAAAALDQEEYVLLYISIV